MATQTSVTIEISRLIQTNLDNYRLALSKEGVSDEILEKVFGDNIVVEKKERFNMEHTSDDIILVLNYTPRCHLLLGDFRRKGLAEFKKSVLADKKYGCFYNEKFNFGPGWGFQNSQLPNIQKALKGYKFRQVECEELKTELREKEEDLSTSDNGDLSDDEGPAVTVTSKILTMRESNSDVSDTEDAKPKGKAPSKNSDVDATPTKVVAKKAVTKIESKSKKVQSSDDEAPPKKDAKKPKKEVESESEDDAPPPKKDAKKAKDTKKKVPTPVASDDDDNDDLLSDEDDTPPKKDSKSKTSKDTESDEPQPLASFKKNKWGNGECPVTGLVAMKLPLGKEGATIGVVIGEQDKKAKSTCQGLASILALEDNHIQMCKDKKLQFITPANINRLKKIKEFKEIAKELDEIYSDES